MATYKIPYQNLTYQAPDEGVVYKRTDSPLVFVNKGGTIYQMQSSQYQGDLSALPTYSWSGETEKALAGIYGSVKWGDNASQDVFQNLTPTTNNYTQTVSPVNPNGIQVTDQSGVIVQQSPTTLQAQANAAAEGGTMPPPDGSQPISNIDTNYYFKPGETLEAYNSRIQEYNKTGMTQLGLAPASSAYSSSDPITSSNIGSTSQTNFITPTQTTPFNASSVVSSNPLVDSQGQQTALTTTESDIQRRIDELMKLNDAEAGRAAYQTEQNRLAGVNEAQTTVNDLQSKLNVILNEAKQIQLTTQPNAGVTTQIDQRQRNEALRVNAIAALSASSLIDAAKGQLTSAQYKADKAVEEKFGPIEAQIKATTNNLSLILNSPNYSRQEKNIALAQQSVQNQIQQAIAQQKADQSNIYNIAIKAAEGGATADILTKIQNATSPIQALEIAAQAGVLKEDLAPSGTTIINSGGRQLLINDSTGAIIKDLGATNTSTANNTLTISEAKSLGLPETLAGQSQDKIISSLNSSTPPTWFRDYLQAKLNMSVTSSTLQTYWEELRQQVLGGSTSTSSSGLDFNSF